MESVDCIICGRKLKSTQSIKDQMGPVCKKKIGQLLNGYPARQRHLFNGNIGHEDSNSK